MDDATREPALTERMLLAIPFVRHLADEKTRCEQEAVHLKLRAARLDQRIHELESELAAVKARCSALASEAAERGRSALWVPAGHFYSPIVDPRDDCVRRATEAEARPSVSPQELGLDEEEILRWFRVIARYYQGHPFPEQPSGGSRYYYANPNFPLADALALLAMMVEKKPRRYVEVGSGFSSCAAVDISERSLQGRVEMTFLEPHPEAVFQLLGEASPYCAKVVRTKLQDAPLDLFTALEAGDILFIDSSHVAKTGSDVVDYLFRLLPALAPGVLVHIHDIFFPFEYPAAWIADENRSWNETYCVRAFLDSNPRFRVIYFSDWIFKCRRDLLEAAMPVCVRHRGGSLWIECAPH